MASTPLPAYRRCARSGIEADIVSVDTTVFDSQRSELVEDEQRRLHELALVKSEEREEAARMRKEWVLEAKERRLGLKNLHGHRLGVHTTPYRHANTAKTGKEEEEEEEEQHSSKQDKQQWKEQLNE